MLIRKEKLLEQLDGYAKDSMLPVSVVRSMIMKAYEVDAVPVTRCAFCIHHSHATCAVFLEKTEESFFCKYGER